MMRIAVTPIGRARAALLAAAALGGCTVGPNYRPPAEGAPAAFVEPQPAPGAAVDPATWWTSFGDPVLDGLVVRALADNPDMAAAASRVRQARLGEIAARAQGLPSINATGGASHVEFSKNAGFASLAQLFSGSGGGGAGGGASNTGIALPGSGITTFSAGFDANWEIDIFGGVRRGVEAARARTEGAEWSRRDAAVTLSAEVAQAYFALRLDQAQATVITQEIDRQRRALGISGDVAKVGLVPPIDVTRQRGRITDAEARLAPVQGDAAVRVHALAVLLGATPEALASELSTPPTVMSVLPVVPAGMPSDLLRRRPDIRSAERQLAAANADIGVAVADLYPRFSLTGMAELISTSLATLFERDSLQLTESGAVTFPLVDFGRRRATVESRREDREQAYLRYRSTVLVALRDVEDALARLETERRRHAALERAVTDQQTSANAILAQYQTGFVAQDSVLTAEADVLSAREQLASSDAQLRQQTAALFKALGGGWSPTPVPVRVER